VVEPVGPLDPERVRSNLALVRREVAEAAGRAGRDPAEVEILAAVKYLEAEHLGVLAEAGITLLGENRAQDLEAKADAWPDAFTWDFIGQLQSRKVKQILPHVRLIHSVASESALGQLDRHARPGTEILVEVNVAGEGSKAGVDAAALPAFLERCAEVEAISVAGLMTMPPWAERPEASRACFARLADLARAHDLHQLSMGTTQDFAVAVQEGATIVRIGSRLYA
jgi:pyridoxal phosphate enzyme (YggS family)